MQKKKIGRIQMVNSNFLSLVVTIVMPTKKGVEVAAIECGYFHAGVKNGTIWKKAYTFSVVEKR